MEILLVDDNLHDMIHFCDEMRLEGHTVDQAHNYSILENICQSSKEYDLIILDFCMPALKEIQRDNWDFGLTSGVYLFEELIQNRFTVCPFVVFTGMDPHTSIFQMAIDKLKRHKTYRGYFQKPSEIDEILNSINQYKVK